ncbi:ABC transporter permease [Shouchella lonarensis]|uniref:ABC-2 type transport system permease protein n=1 Tax=Shouchella lonarensis TaxID=1464122 RepID=A0A1G6GVE8_9BACI|nr:ABC transporter permease [Shouchella lonarensis]SDB85992.1 ABC-2 type transport system permease protein [Shouchella lonarensis]
MHNFWTIVGHTAMSRLKTKAYMWSTVITMALIVGLLNIGAIMSFFSGEEEGTDVVAVVTEEADSGDFADALNAQINDQSGYEYLPVVPEKGLSEVVKNGEYPFVLHVTGSGESLQATLYSEGDDYGTMEAVQHNVQQVKESFLVQQLDVDLGKLEAIYAPVAFENQPFDEEGTVDTEESQGSRHFMIWGTTYAIFLIVLTCSMMIATEVATEKSSRVMELIVSSVNPVVQMFGKLIGLGLVSLVSLASLIVAVVIGSSFKEDGLDGLITGGAIDIGLLGYALVLTLLGYFLYGGVAAMLGALVSRTEDVQQAVQPLVFLALAAFIIVQLGMGASDATFVQVLSYIPFFSPQLLILRIGEGVIAPWEIVLILAILVVSVIIVNLLAARVYKGGVLMYGKLSFKHGIKQALALSKKEK